VHHTGLSRENTSRPRKGAQSPEGSHPSTDSRNSLQPDVSASTQRPRSKSVSFNFDSEPEQPLSPERSRYHHRHRSERNEDGSSSKTPDAGTEDNDRDGRRRRHRRDGGNRAPSPTGSNETIDLPDRFDEQGRRKPGRDNDPIADRIEEFLSGKGSVGGLFSRLTGGGDNNGKRRRRSDG